MPNSTPRSSQRDEVLSHGRELFDALTEADFDTAVHLIAGMSPDDLACIVLERRADAVKRTDDTNEIASGSAKAGDDSPSQR
jgi:hypothetical protein